MSHRFAADALNGAVAITGSALLFYGGMAVRLAWQALGKHRARRRGGAS